MAVPPAKPRPPLGRQAPGHLRPFPESRILWLQQLGRGLRKTMGDEQLTVIDYIGNHRSFLLKPRDPLQPPVRRPGAPGHAERGQDWGPDG